MRFRFSIFVMLLLVGCESSLPGTNSEGNSNDRSNETDSSSEKEDSEVECDFIISEFTNGEDATQVLNHWSCQASSSQSLFVITIFNDGTGNSSAIGTFTWQKKACGELKVISSYGQLTIYNLAGSIQSGVGSFYQKFDSTGEEITVVCELIEGTPSVGEIQVENDETITTSLEEGSSENNSKTADALLDADETSETSSNEIFVIIADDNKFLGVINKNRFDSNSICNGFSSYGSQFSTTSIWNEFGSYGSDFSSTSAFNEFSSTPPIIYSFNVLTNELIAFAYLTTNSFKTPRIDTYELFALLRSSGCDIER